MERKQSKDACLSIGAISRATGIPAATLRTWERRYGFPDPQRTDSGHRRYTPSVIGRLRLISEAVDQGHRASDVISLDSDELEVLMEASATAADGRTASNAPSAPTREAKTTKHADGDDTAEIEPVSPDRRPEAPITGVANHSSGELLSIEGHGWLEDWMQAVTDLDGNALNAALRTSWNRLGGLAFLEKRVAPFLTKIGQAWQQGNIGIVHEHYTSEQLQDFLSSRWRPLSDRAEGPTAVCATLPGEDHVIGLHIAALVMAMAGWRIIFLGARTPPTEIVDAASIDRADAVVISFSERYGVDHARRSVDSLHSMLPDDIKLVAGGRGAPTKLPDSPSFSTLDPFYEWALDQAQGRS